MYDDLNAFSSPLRAHIFKFTLIEEKENLSVIFPIGLHENKCSVIFFQYQTIVSLF